MAITGPNPSWGTPLPTAPTPSGGLTFPGGLGGSGGLLPGQSGSQSQSQGSQQSTSQSAGQQLSQSYIPDYSQTPILEMIAKYSAQMAPQVYQWGMDQFARNQGNIDQMMRSALTYASPQRVASEMGQAEAGVQQGAEAGRQNAIRDLESYGIDPSSGRYAALDTANRVMSGAAAAGAGNQQRMATEAAGNAMQNQAISAGMQNTQLGYGAANAMTGLLGTGMQLKYAPLGNISQGSSASTSQSSGQQGSQSVSGTVAPTGTGMGQFAAGGSVDDEATSGGFVSQELSPSAGAHVDDIDARLNSGEFVIPKDVAAWKGQEFFYKLMAQSRKMRATAGQEGGSDDAMGMEENGATEGQTGYAGGGEEPQQNFASGVGYREGGQVGGPRRDSKGNLISDVQRIYGRQSNIQRDFGTYPDTHAPHAMINYGNVGMRDTGGLAAGGEVPRQNLAGGGPASRQTYQPAVQGMRIRGGWHPWQPSIGVRQIGSRAGKMA